MEARREFLGFLAALASLIVALLGPSLFGGRILSPSDVIRALPGWESESDGPAGYEPQNRLLLDPVLQFEPWLEFNRSELRQGRLPVWNPWVGLGAPHLANAQSAVFDPFHLIAYVGRLPEALAWMAAARLLTSGAGMFLLTRAWGVGPWGRWFAGLAFPYCGFLSFWLLYPVASVAVWMPWLLLAGERLLKAPSPRRAAGLATATLLTLLGGHIQTSAHVLIAAALAAVATAWARTGEAGRFGGRLLGWLAAVGLGVAASAVVIVPLAAYLTRSPVWEDRVRERPTPWELARPRLAEAVNTALPYLYGSERRGHPNLAPAVGANNINEAAAGFAGLGTLLWLAPLGATAGGGRAGARRFLIVLLALGAFGAFRLPPIDNLLRALPVLNVIDHRRLTLWVAFGLIGLGALGLDRLPSWRPSRPWTLWASAWAAASILAVGCALAVPRLEPVLTAKAQAHYRAAAERDPAIDATRAEALAERQVANALMFLPRYALRTAALLGGLTCAFVLMGGLRVRHGRRGLASETPATPSRGSGVVNAQRIPFDLGGRLRRFSTLPRAAAWLAAVLCLGDLWLTARGANPQVAAAAYRPASPIITYLRKQAPSPARVLGLGAALPPNLLMRYGLANLRNYDAIEVAGTLESLAGLYEAEPGRPVRTSRLEADWNGARRRRDRLRACGVTAVVGETPPPAGLFERVERVGSLWVGHWPERRGPLRIRRFEGPIVELERTDVTIHRSDETAAVPIAALPGWRAEAGGRPIAVLDRPGPFVMIHVPKDVERITLRYEPRAVKVGGVITLAAVSGIVALATWSGRRKKPAIALGSPLGAGLKSTFVISRAARPGPFSEGRGADAPLHL